MSPGPGAPGSFRSMRSRLSMPGGLRNVTAFISRPQMEKPSFLIGSVRIRCPVMVKIARADRLARFTIDRRIRRPNTAPDLSEFEVPNDHSARQDIAPADQCERAGLHHRPVTRGAQNNPQGQAQRARI